MRTTSERRSGLLLLALGLIALAVAYGAQDFLHMVPCELCLWERWPYRLAVLVGLLMLILPPRLARPLLWLALLGFLANVGITGLHIGVERGWWQSPLPECNATNIVVKNLSDLIANLPTRPSKPCDAPTYLIPGLPISFAELDLLYSLLCVGLAMRRARLG